MASCSLKRVLTRLSTRVLNLASAAVKKWQPERFRVLKHVLNVDFVICACFKHKLCPSCMF